MALAAQAAQRALEKLHRLQKSKTRADKLLNDYRYGRVIDVLAHDPAKLYQVEQEMISEGLLTAISLTQPKKTLLALKNGDADDSGAAPTDIDPYAEMDDEKVFNRNQSTFGAMSFNTIFRGLNRAEPAIFTSANLKSLQVRGQRKDSLEAITKLLEHVTDIAKDDVIDMNNRTKTKTIDYIVKQYHLKGDRGKNMIMPPNYTMNGPYTTTPHDVDHIKVILKWTKQSILIKVPRLKEVYIDHDYSTMRAKLRAVGSDFSKAIWPLFAAIRLAPKVVQGAAATGVKRSSTFMPMSFFPPTHTHTHPPT